MKENSKVIINKINSNRSQIYYKLQDLKELTGLSDRSLKYRMKTVSEKYSNMPSLLRKEGRAWNIHNTILVEFLPKYRKSQTSIYNHPWKTFLTWNMADNYDTKYHNQLIRELKDFLPNANIAFVIEADTRGYNHLHAMLDIERDEVEVEVKKVLNRYLIASQYRCQVEKINNTIVTVQYLKKNGELTII